MAKRSKEPESAAEQNTIPHERAAGYRVIFADGALVRRQKDDLLVTFYHDDCPVRSETAQFTKEADGSTKMRPLGGFTHEYVRSHEVTIRMRLEDAVGLTTVLLTRLSVEAPDLLKARGIEMVEESAQ